MQRVLLISLLCSALGGFLPLARPLERAETLQAINWVENPTNHTRRGSRGELGPYQFRVQTWRLHTARPFSLATVRAHADEVAVKHYEWIKVQLAKAGIDPSPFNIALAWNSGVNAVLTGRVPTVSYHYAERVTNLVEKQRAARSVARGHPASAREVAQATAPAPVVSFSIRPAAPSFVLATEAPLYEPVVLTEKASPRPLVAVSGPALAFQAVTAPQLALIR